VKRNGGRDSSHGTWGYGTITSPGNDPYVITVGAGYLDVLAALNNADTISSTKRALSPSVVYNGSTKQVVLVRSSGLVWGDTNLTMSIVWGDQVLLPNSIVWGHSLVWGDRNPSSEAINVAIYGEK
jgi:hypothetical protein